MDYDPDYDPDFGGFDPARKARRYHYYHIKAKRTDPYDSVTTKNIFEKDVCDVKISDSNSAEQILRGLVHAGFEVIIKEVREEVENG